MKRENFILMLICLVNQADSQDRTPAICTENRTKNSFCNNEKSCNATGIVLCSNTNIGFTIPCIGTQAFCSEKDDGDICSSINPCGSESSNSGQFECTGDGYYPNPFDCTSYYFCSLNADKTEYTRTLYNCPSGNVFSPSTGNYCARRNSIINNCQTVSCGNITEPKYIQIKYGFNKQYYALCARDQNPDIITPIVYVFVCPANSVPNINTMPAKCSYNCWKTGFFQNTLDNSKYFECYLNNYLRFESVERRCPNGSYFEPNRSECVVKLRSFSEVSKN